MTNFPNWLHCFFTLLFGHCGNGFCTVLAYVVNYCYMLVFIISFLGCFLLIAWLFHFAICKVSCTIIAYVVSYCYISICPGKHGCAILVDTPALDSAGHTVRHGCDCTCIPWRFFFSSDTTRYGLIRFKIGSDTTWYGPKYLLKKRRS